MKINSKTAGRSASRRCARTTDLRLVLADAIVDAGLGLADCCSPGGSCETAETQGSDIADQKPRRRSILMRTHCHLGRFVRPVVLLGWSLWLAISPASQAGSVFISGHDADFHASPTRGPNPV